MKDAKSESVAMGRIVNMVNIAAGSVESIGMARLAADAARVLVTSGKHDE